MRLRKVLGNDKKRLYFTRQ